MLEQTDETAAVPEFAIVLRGYDRIQVDSYLEQLRAWIERERIRFETTKQHYATAYREVNRLRDRVAELERVVEDRATPSFETLGVEVAQMFRKAGETAEELRRQGRKEADAVLAEAQANAAALVRTAEERAAEITREAERDRDEAESLLARLRTEADAVGDEIRAQAEAEAATVLADAHDRSAVLVSDAEQAVENGRREAERVVAEAEETRRATVLRMEAQRSEVEAQITQLKEKRDWMLEELDRLRGLLENVTSYLRTRADNEISVVEKETVPAARRASFDADLLPDPLPE